VVLLLGSANHDPRAFHDPERLDLGREGNRHLDFGFGLHHCLGAPLAHLEAQIAIPELLRRARAIEPTVERVAYRENLVLRGLVDLTVLLTSA